MDWLAALDTAWFRFCNGSLVHPALDILMPLVSGSELMPVLVVAGVALAWKGGPRGRISLLLLVLAVAVGDGLIVNPLKDWIGRPRPGVTLETARLLVGVGSHPAMPSAHAANWFAATAVLAWFYRRSLWLMVPAALVVCFSRVYTGAHYPLDTLVGALLGATYATLLVFGAERLWQTAGPRWFPLWHARMPSLRGPRPVSPSSRTDADAALEDRHWVRLGYVLIGVLLFGRLLYLSGSTLQLSEDEAYQWLWSKHLDLSYYSKPPLIAYAQFLGTSIFGDRELGVRFLSPVLASLLGVWLLRFFERDCGQPRTGFWVVLLTLATPLLAVGATLLTIDPLSVFFWTAAMFSGWRAITRDSTNAWAWTGLWMGLGFLSKYVALLQWLCWAVFFVLWRPARAQLRRPGPWLALGINLAALAPVLIWNARHQWITVTHLGERGGLDQAWHPTLRFVGEFLGAELGLLNPVFFVAAVWAAVALWRRPRTHPLPVYLFSMGTPLFAGYLLYSFRSRVLPNWIAPAVVPMFCLMAWYWAPKLAEPAARGLRRTFAGGLWLGVIAVTLLHDTSLLPRLTGISLPARIDPMRRVTSWRNTAGIVSQTRERLLLEGHPVFLIGNHYGITSLITFYLPEARAALAHQPLVYCLLGDRPKNQFWFWDRYDSRRGQNALFIAETRTPRPPPPQLQQQFATVTDLGLHDVFHKGRLVHQIQIFECRELR